MFETLDNLSINEDTETIKKIIWLRFNLFLNTIKPKFDLEWEWLIL